MRINPTASGLGVFMLEKKKLWTYRSNYWSSTGCSFLPRKMPNIYNVLVVTGRVTVGQQINMTREVQQLLGNNRVRDVAMSATDSLMREMEVIDTGALLSVTIREATLGRIFNVLGEPIDNLSLVDTRIRSSIHRSAPALIQLDAKLFIFETII